MHRVALLLTFVVPVGLIWGRGLGDAALSVTGVLFLVACARDRRWEWLREPWVVVAIAIWGYLVLIVSPLALDPLVSLERALPWIRWVLFAAALQHWILAELRALRLLSSWLALLVACISIDLLVQYVTGTSLSGFPADGPRLTGPFGRLVPGAYESKFLWVALGPVFVWAVSGSGLGRAVLACATLLYFLVVIFLTGERGAFLTAGLGALLPTLTLWWLSGARVRRLLEAGTIGLVAAAVIVLGSQTAIKMRMVDETRDQVMNFWDSHYGQLYLTALRIWRDYPVMGAGLKQFRALSREPAYASATYGPGLHPHNFYLEWLCDAGLVGLIGFCALVFAWSRYLLVARPRGAQGRMMIAVAGAILLAQLWPLTSSGSFFTNWTAQAFWLPLGWALAYARYAKARA